MTNIFIRDYHNFWLEGVGGFFAASGELALLPQNPPPSTILLHSILMELHTGHALSIELHLLQKLTSCDRSDIEVLQILTISKPLPLTIELTENIVKAKPN